jgi:hypothetical protein
MPAITVIDTNVVLVANEQHPSVSHDCIVECSLNLQKIMQQGCIALDDNYRILSEYQKKTQPRKGKRPGDAFVKWVLRNICNPKYCELVILQEHPERGFSSFPDDSELLDFDSSDRMFVAVAIAHNSHPPILEATDSKWVNWAPALKRHGILVNFLCKNDIECFHKHKISKQKTRKP